MDSLSEDWLARHAKGKINAEGLRDLLAYGFVISDIGNSRLILVWGEDEPQVGRLVDEILVDGENHIATLGEKAYRMRKTTGFPWKQVAESLGTNVGNAKVCARSYANARGLLWPVKVESNDSTCWRDE